MVRRVPTKQRNASIKRERDQNLVIRLGLLLVCGLTLAVGFVYAAGQHFESLKLGYQTEDLRRVRDRLEAEHRRNILVREEAASPARLERAARQLGMQAMQPSQIDPLKRAAKSFVEKSLPASTQPKKSQPAIEQKQTATDRDRKNRARNKPI